MGQFGQRVGLVHELAQWGGAKELLDGRGDGADVDEALGGDDVQILQGHALADHALHARKANAELVLQQLTHAADAAVAQVVDVVGLADAVRQAVEVVDGGEHVVHHDVLGDQDVDVLADGVLQGLAFKLLAQQLHVAAVDQLLDAHLGGVKVDVVADVHHAVGEDAHVLAVGLQRHGDHAGVGDLAGLVAGDDLARLGQQLPGEGVGHRLGQLKAGDTGVQGQLLVELIASHVGDLIAAAVKEQAVQQGLGGLHRGRIAGAQLAVDLDQALVPGGAGVLVQGGDDALVLAEDLLDALVGDGAGAGVADAAQPGGGLVGLVSAHGLQEPGDGELAVLVDADVEHVVGVGLILQPGAVIRDHGGGVDADHGLVQGLIEVHTGRTDDLGDDDALGAVDDKGAPVGHDGKIAHEDLLLLDLLGLLVAQAHADLQRLGVGGVAGLALFLVVLGLVVHGVVDEAQLQVAGIVRDGIHIPEHFPETCLQKPFVGALLDLQQIGHLLDLRGAGKALSQSLAVENIFWHWCTLLILFRTPGVVATFNSPGIDLRSSGWYTKSRWNMGHQAPPLHIEQDILPFWLCACQERNYKFM